MFHPSRATVVVRMSNELSLNDLDAQLAALEGSDDGDSSSSSSSEDEVSIGLEVL